MLYWIFLYPSILVKSEEGYNQGHYDLLDSAGDREEMDIAYYS